MSNFLFYTIEFSFEHKKVKASLSVLELCFFSIIIGFGFSVVNNILFYLKNNKFKDEYAVGLIKFGKWKALPEIKYVSVFKQPMEDDGYVFEVNLWYKRNKHFDVYVNNYYEPTLEMGFHIANQLNSKLFDATKPNDYKYLDMEELRQKYVEPN